MKSNIYLFTKLMLIEEDVFTYNDIAKKASISNKTIRNSIKDIIDLMSKYNISIEKSPGIGIKLHGDKKDRLKCFKECETQIVNSNEIPSKIRQIVIIYLLLNGKRSLTIGRLENILYITRPSIYNDLKIVDNFLNDYGIKINKTRKNGISIIGGEKRIRHALLDLSFKILEYSDNSYTFSSELNSFYRSIKSRNSNEYKLIKEFILKLVKYTNSTITNSDLNRATIFMIIAFERIKDNRYVSLNLETINKVKNKKLPEFINDNIFKLTNTFHLEVTNEEIVYISAQLSSYITSSYENLFEESSNPELLVKVIEEYYNYLLNYIQKFDLKFFKDCLFPFLEKTMQKYNFEYDCYNPYTDLIKNTYIDLYQLAEKINMFTDKYLYTKLPEGAIASIALVLVNLREMYISKTVCALVSQEHVFKNQLIISILKNNIPNIEIDCFENVDYLNTDYDLVFSTFEIHNDRIDIIQIPPVINDEFLILLNKQLHELRNNKKSGFFKN